MYFSVVFRTRQRRGSALFRFFLDDDLDLLLVVNRKFDDFVLSFDGKPNTSCNDCRNQYISPTIGKGGETVQRP